MAFKICTIGLLAALLCATPIRASSTPVDSTASRFQRRLHQTVNFAAGAKFGFPENAFNLASKGGPYSSIQGTRRTVVKAGAPPSPPVFQYSYDPKRSDAPAPAPKATSKASGRKLLQNINFSAGTKFGFPENAFSLVSKGGPHSSIQGTRTTVVKAGAPPSPPVFQFSYDPKRSDAPAPAPKSGGSPAKSKADVPKATTSAPAPAPKATTPAAAPPAAKTDGATPAAAPKAGAAAPAPKTAGGAASTPAPKTGATPAPAPKTGATPAPTPKTGATPAPAPKTGATPAPKGAATPAPASKASGSTPASAPKDDGASKQDGGDDE